MRHFSTLFCILALGLAFEMGTSCTKQTIPPVINNVVKDFKVIQHDTTTSQPATEHHCSNGHGGQG